EDSPGARTERRGLSGPVRVLLGGETSPAVLLGRERIQTLTSPLAPVIYSMCQPFSRVMAAETIMSTLIKADATGAVMLPAELCRAAGLTPGAELVAEVECGRIVVQAPRIPILGADYCADGGHPT